MFGTGQLRSLALALCLYHVSAFAGVSTRGGVISTGAARANAAVPPRAIDGADQQLAGVVKRARGGALFRRHAATVPLKDGDSSGKNGLLAKYMRALDQKPITTKIITSGVICGVGDIMAQALTFKTAATEAVTLSGFLDALDLTRFGIYGVLGALWIAPVVHYWFDALEAAFKDKKAAAGAPPPSFSMKMFKAVKMVTVDQSIGAPLVNAGVIFFFTFATALSVGTGGLDAGKKAGSVLKTKIWSTMLGCWRVWPVANLINFAFVPANLRVLFMNVIGLGWNIYLSTAVN